MTCKIEKNVADYIAFVDTHPDEHCIEQHLFCAFIQDVFETENLYWNEQQIEKYFSYQKYFPFDLFVWERCVFVLHNCIFKENGRPRFPDLFLFVGRGTGKNAYLAFEDFCLLTPTQGSERYDIDICAMSEDQAKTTFDDIYEILENPKWTKKLKKHFYWTKEKIVNRKTRSTLKFRTNNPKGKDGLRSGKVDFDEVHAYENWDNIEVFTTGLGKRKHPRRTYTSTDGKVREGPLDELKEKSMQILNGEIPDDGFLPFICRINEDEQIHNKKCWNFANPSLRYLPDLLEEIEKEYKDYVKNPDKNTSFATKRMNYPKADREIGITDFENIKSTNRPLPELEGMPCVCGIDMTKIRDFLSVYLLFRIDGIYYAIGKSWVCKNSPDYPKITAPLIEWSKMEVAGIQLIEIVDGQEINPDVVADWIEQMGMTYDIRKVAADTFRLGVLKKKLKEIGFDTDDKDLFKLCRPSDLMKVIDPIDHVFNTQALICGDNPLMRWAMNNVKMVPKERGNFEYGKIEPRKRKTDPFMAVAHAFVIEDAIPESSSAELPEDFDIYTF